MPAIAVAALVADGRILLVHRHPSREHYPDCWDLPGGHIELDESPSSAVRRECKEELGIAVVAAIAMPIRCSDPKIEKHAFLVTSWAGDPHNVAPDEHDALGWFTADELRLLKISDPAALDDLIKMVGTSPETDTE